LAGFSSVGMLDEEYPPIEEKTFSIFGLAGNRLAEQVYIKIVLKLLVL
jgi:hypothetical protein